MKKIRIGQIGIGHNHAEGKMLAVRKFPELFELVGYCEKNEEWVERRGGLPCYRGLPRMEEGQLLDNCDALLVETDVWDLTKTAQRCIRAGKHIHLDKPASGSLAEYRALLDEAQEKNLTVQLGYMYRYNDALRRCRELARDGTLGEIYQIDAEMSLYHPKDYRQWLGNFRGGTMYIFGSHLIDLVVGILGEPRNVVPILKSTGYEDVQSQDNCFAVLEYEKAVARVTSLSVEVNGFGMRRFAVMGSLGTVEIKPLEHGTKMTLSLKEQDNGRPRELPIIDTPDDGRYDEMMKDFYLVATGQKEPEYSYDHEWMLQKTLYRAVGLE